MTINLENLTHKFEFYWVLIPGSFGFLANLMNIHVSSRREMQKTNMGFYNICLSVSNILGIIFVGFLTLFPQSLNYNLLVTSDIMCRLFPYLSRVFAQLTAWLNIMISIDRVILMSYNNLNEYNNRSSNLKDKSKLFFIVLGLVFIILFINIPGLFFFLSPQTITQDSITNQTKLNISQCKSTPLIGLIRDFIGIASRTLIPFIIRLILTIILIYKLLGLKINATTLFLKREYTFTVTFVVFNFFYILADIFSLVSNIFLILDGYNQTYISIISNQSAIANFVYIISVLTTFLIYFVLLFFINLFVHKGFRRETKKLYLQWILLRL